MAASQGRSDAAAETTDRELVFTRVFDAPRELVFDAWTDPKRVVERDSMKQGFKGTLDQLADYLAKA